MTHRIAPKGGLTNVFVAARRRPVRIFATSRLSRRRWIGLPETGIGMVPGWSGTQRLVTRFGAAAVRRLALTGEIVTAERALQLGLIDEIAPRGQGLEQASTLCAKIVTRAPVANTIAKQMINAAEGEDAAAAMEILAGSLVSYTSDLKEGVASFVEKRTPQFKGR